MNKSCHYKLVIISFLRFVRGLGIYYIFVSVILILSFFTWIHTLENELIKTIIAGFVVYFIHSYRKDYPHIKLYFKKTYSIFIIDYFLVSIPIITSFVLKSHYSGLVVYLALVVGICFSPPNNILRKLQNISLPFLHPLNPIIKSGLRVYFPLFAILIILIYFALLMKSGEVTFALTSFYIAMVAFLNYQGDQKFFIRKCVSPNLYLFRKITSGLKDYSALVLLLLPVMFFIETKYTLDTLVALMSGAFLYVSVLLSFIAFENSKVKNLPYHFLLIALYIGVSINYFFLAIWAANILIIGMLSMNTLRKSIAW